MFKLQIKTDNDAFGNEPSQEIARILREVADNIETLRRPQQNIRDANGNLVGGYRLT